MFDIKSLGIRDWIILALAVLIIGLGYKYWTSHSTIKKLGNEIEELKKKIESSNKLIEMDITNSDSNSDSDSESDPEPSNYKTNKTIETFNNSNKLECDNGMCWVKKPSPIETKNQVNNSIFIPAPVPVPAPIQTAHVPVPIQTLHVPIQTYDIPMQLPSVKQEDIDAMQDITSFLSMADEVDRIMENDICIPIDFKKIVDQIYESPETVSNQEIKFNPVILDSNDVIEVKPEQINSKIELQVPDFINIPSDLNQDQITNVLEESEQKNIDSIKQVSEVVESESDKYKTMKINDIKNLAKKLNIKLSEHGRPKNKEQLIVEINKCQSANL